MGCQKFSEPLEPCIHVRFILVLEILVRKKEGAPGGVHVPSAVTAVGTGDARVGAEVHGARGQR